MKNRDKFITSKMSRKSQHGNKISRWTNHQWIKKYRNRI